VQLVSSDAQCIVTDEVELRQERLPLPAAIQRLGVLTTTGHRVVAGEDAKVSITADGAVLVDQVNLAAPIRDRADSPLSLVS